ncbi:MAG TPA: diphosphomevalonate decarboxylase [Lacisediminihabitans sp.]|nr:diphosphomevalonate decarboxylase [Lacisediminihabitans sp.]HXD61440.1 diphosphomevalonate decarboxylase [Lacisediminihabitans sp.]
MDQTLRDGCTAAARAHSNIALIKYWGKRDAALNIPAVGSISVTLDALSTETTVSFDDSLASDELLLAGAPADATRVSRFLDLVREQAGTSARARVESRNDFPTGAGLASSASGFAALAVAANAAAGLALNERQLSILARRGSGSAARSLFGGVVELHAGIRDDGEDAFAEPLLSPTDWPLSVVVAITDFGQKSIDSTAGMGESSLTSPFYPVWVETAEDDLAGMRSALAARDFERVGELTEYSCLKLHALMLSTRPALVYWNAATVAGIHAVRELRGSGIPAYFTIDAGPQLKVLCPPEQSSTVANALNGLPGVHETRVSGLGPGARLLS